MYARRIQEVLLEAKKGGLTVDLDAMIAKGEREAQLTSTGEEGGGEQP